MCRGETIWPHFFDASPLHSRLAGSRRPEIRLRFRADLPGQREHGGEEGGEGESLLGKMYGIHVQRLGKLGKFLE